MDIKSFYFEWMTFLAFNNSNDRASYINLLTQLNDIPFCFSIPMDRNRYKDGLHLRDRFGLECGIPDEILEREFDGIPCSILEMMVALSLKCEEQIMSNPDLGNRTSNWFNEMLSSLHLTDMRDNNYDENYVQYVLYRFLNREYDYDGNGGLFTVVNPRMDMREAEIWYQMCWYISSVLKDI